MKFGNFSIGIHALLVLRKQNFNWYLNNRNLFNWYLSRSFFKISIYFKTLLKAKRKISFRGSFIKSKDKHLKQGEKFQTLKMLLAILFIYLWLFAKRIWKDFSKGFAKIKQVVQMWSKYVKEKKSNPFISSKFINWFNSK